MKYDPEPIELIIGSRRVSLLRVKDLERFVDREALLRDDTEEPPYWAHLWTGALTLAQYVEERVECRDRSILDIGCGLGLTGVIAALKGGHVTFADKELDALTFAAANAQRNHCSSFQIQLLDFTGDTLHQQFSLILGAEILYDRLAFPALIAFLTRHLASDGYALIADAGRTNTAEFYQLLDQAGLQWTRENIQQWEDRLPIIIGIVTIKTRKQ